MRKIPKSFFWIDQQLIRGGTWTKLSREARLAYVAVAASCDREGLTIWSRSKLMQLAGALDPDAWEAQITELRELKLVEILQEQAPPAIKLISLNGETESPEASGCGRSLKTTPQRSPGPIVIHNHTSIHFTDEKAHHVESGTTN